MKVLFIVPADPHLQDGQIGYETQQVCKAAVKMSDFLRIESGEKHHVVVPIRISITSKKKTSLSSIMEFFEENSRVPKGLHRHSIRSMRHIPKSETRNFVKWIVQNLSKNPPTEIIVFVRWWEAYRVWAWLDTYLHKAGLSSTKVIIQHQVSKADSRQLYNEFLYKIPYDALRIRGIKFFGSL